MEGRAAQARKCRFRGDQAGNKVSRNRRDREQELRHCLYDELSAVRKHFATQIS